MKMTIRKPMAGSVILAAVTAASAGETVPFDQKGNPPPPLVFRPDAMVREGPRGPFSGNDIYNQSGVSQTATTRIARGATQTFAVRLQNDGNINDSFLLKPGKLSSSYTFSYWQKGKDVTPIVEAGKFSTGDLAPGQSVSLIVKLFVRMAAKQGSVIRQPLTLVSRNSPDKKDTVAIRAKLVTN